MTTNERSNCIVDMHIQCCQTPPEFEIFIKHAVYCVALASVAMLRLGVLESHHKRELFMYFHGSKIPF